MASIPVVRMVAQLREHVCAWRTAGETVALVPTMGALHAGHLSLVATAREHAARVVVSIFVNPTQFAPQEDFAAYPRDEALDLRKLEGPGADLVFAPSAEEMYPEGFATAVTVAGPAAQGLEDRSRPHFFGGVATVVAKLLGQAGCDVAVFGEKDYQQLLVVRRMAADLDIPCRIIGGKTVREPDGLALSSRNAYLSPEERRVAPKLHEALADLAEAVRGGRPVAEAVSEAEGMLERAGFRVDYLEVRDAETLEPWPGGERPMRALGAVFLGRTRLIDNVPV